MLGTAPTLPPTSTRWLGRQEVAGGAGSLVIADVIELGVRLKVRWRQHDGPSDGECALIGAFVDRLGELPKASKRGCSTKRVLEQIAA